LDEDIDFEGEQKSAENERGEVVEILAGVEGRELKKNEQVGKLQNALCCKRNNRLWRMMLKRKRMSLRV